MTMEQDLANAIDQGDTEALFRLLAPESQSNSKEVTTNGLELEEESLEEKLDDLSLTEEEQVQLEPLRQKYPILDTDDVQSIYYACNGDRDLAETILESLANSEAVKQSVPDAISELDTEAYSKALQEWSVNFPSLQNVTKKTSEDSTAEFGKVTFDSHTLLYNLRFQKLSTMFPNMEERNIAQCLNANNCKYKETFSELVKRSRDHSTQEPVNTKQLNRELKSTMDTSRQVRLDNRATKNIWVSTGTKVGEMYENCRLKAKELARLRNQMFMQAARAASIGNKRAASEYARRGHEYNKIMKELHEDAADAIFVQRNQNGESTIDLHGLHVKEALVVLERKLQELESTNVSVSRDIIIVTGSGHHTKGKKTPARLYPAVEHFLLSHQYQFEVVKDTNRYAGAFLVHLR